MSKNLELPEVLPVFPLPRALLLPRARLPLHIFEPRYLAMIEDVMKTPHRLLGMIQPSEHEGKERLSAIGCAGKLTQFSETEDGRYMITITGVSRYRIGGEIEGFHPYRKFEVDWHGFDQDHGTTEKLPCHQCRSICQCRDSPSTITSSSSCLCSPYPCTSSRYLCYKDVSTTSTIKTVR